MAMNMHTIFDYQDYRDLMKEVFEERKATLPQYGYRMMAEELGMDTSNIYRILEKEAHLPARCQSRAIECLGLSGRSAEYFVLLIAYGRERNAKARLEIMENAQALRDVARRQIAQDELSYFRDWWVAALRSMLEVVDGRIIPKELASKLNPPVPETEVVRALELLQELGLVKKASSGRLVLTDAHLTAGTESEKVNAVRQYQRQILSLASESMERFSPDLRDISTLTLTVDAHSFEEVREILRECRRQIQKCVGDIRSPNRVMQLSMAFFPVSDMGKSS
jgi:uncharacterized protein (TIGR02147 family)